MSRALYLFARPSFLEGIGRIADFGGALNQYNWSTTPEVADRIALEQDLAAVVDELAAATLTARKQLAKAK